MAAQFSPAPEPPSSSPGSQVETAAPRVTLRNSFAHPFDSAIAAARTCYSTHLVGPEDVTEKQRVTIGAGTYFGGHHTVYQHAHFEFGLENISRHFVWSFLHAHPFYNSEQQSQRYVRLDRAQAYIPLESSPDNSQGNPNFGPAERAIYEKAIARAWEHYRELTRVLEPTARAILSDIWHVSEMSHPRRAKKVEQQSGKRAIEVARYVLPVAAFTTMVHTLSGIVLYRLWRMQAANDTPTEARHVIGEMVARVREVDSQFLDRFNIEPMKDLPERQQPPRDGEAFAREFDGRLSGRTSQLIDYSPRAIGSMAEAYRAVMGLTATECPDGEAIDRMLNPARNLYRRETLNVGVNAPMMRPLDHAVFTFAKKISHTADSQDQRHRMVPGSRPLLTLADTRSPDYITPMLIRENPRALGIYQQAMEEAWAAKNALLDRGVPREFALYLLPNAKAIRLVESGSLLHLLHKWTMRTCFNAQEEIYQASIEEVQQVRAAFPELGRYIGPPCHLRAGISTPICTEGSHFCGVKVWLDFPNIERRI